MKIFPAIDIINGKVVRLYKGDYGRVKNYDLTAEEAAVRFKAAGASHLHAVDLDGARSGVAVNAEAVSRIIAATDAYVEIGGGIRTEAQIESYLAAGASRVILGTVAVKDFDFTVAMAEKYGQKIAVGVDATDGRVAVSGWREVTDIDAEEFCVELKAAGVRACIYTDTSRDGTLSGTNIEVYKRLVKIKGLDITASGGISSVDEIVELKRIGVHSAILGKALYENKIDLAQAVKIAEGT